MPSSIVAEVKNEVRNVFFFEFLEYIEQFLIESGIEFAIYQIPDSMRMDILYMTVNNRIHFYRSGVDIINFSVFIGHLLCRPGITGY